MKKVNCFIPLLVMVLFLPSSMNGQVSRQCNFEKVLEKHHVFHSKFETPLPDFESANMPIITIPIVVHVVWNTPLQNISDSQILSQIDVLNEDFNRLNADSIDTPLGFLGVAGNAQIQFCLAQRDPNGNATTGINRVQTAITGFTLLNYEDVTHTNTGGTDAWNPGEYFNIWVCNYGNGTAHGVAFNPTTGYYGLVAGYASFGRVGTLIPPYHKGRSITHMLGHCFGLRHVSGDDGGTCNGSDLVADTPDQGSDNLGCPSFPKTDVCSPNAPGVMFMNFMDMTDDDCMNLFTQGQVTRMQSFIFQYYNSLTTSTVCQPVSLSTGILKGKVFYDADQDGIQSVNETGLLFQKVTASPVNSIHFTNYNGEYSIVADTATIQSIHFIPQPSWLHTTSTNPYISPVSPAPTCCFDFGTVPSTIFDSASIQLQYGYMKCDKEGPVWLRYKNAGTSIGNGMVSLKMDDSLTLVSSTPPPQLISNDTLYWSFSTLQPGEPRTIFLIVKAPVTDTIDVCFVYSLEMNNSINYIDTICTPVLCAFDPNDKLGLPVGIGSQKYILHNTSIQYTLRFQNIGTASADDVLILDTLDVNLDINTFSMQGSSHDVNVSISNDRVAKFQFENINLVPSIVNEALSQGYVNYSIYPMSGLPDETMINNRGHIYFDSNTPIATNNIYHTLTSSVPSSIAVQNEFALQTIAYPNPFNNEITFGSNLNPTQSYEVAIFDLSGKRLSLPVTSVTKQGDSLWITFDSSHIMAGIYFYRITTIETESVLMGKLIKINK